MKERPRGIGMFSTSATRTGLVFLSTCVSVLCYCKFCCSLVYPIYMVSSCWWCIL